MATSSLLSCYILLNLFFFLLLIEKNFLVLARELSGEHHVIDVKSLLPSTSPSKLMVIYKHDQCSSQACQDKPYHVELLRRDQAHVDYIHRRTTNANARLNTVRRSLFPRVPVFNEEAFHTSNYIVPIGLGTPTKSFSVVFDTGSDLTWIQCIPCDNCYTQKDPFYDPTKSYTFTSISCTSNHCFDLYKYGCSSTNTCLYDQKYGDGSYTNGSFSQDTLRLSFDNIQHFRFGCGHNNSGLFGQADGVLGLGRGAVSIISQTAQLYNKVFTYCLPSWPNATGYLLLGSSFPGVQYTPMLTNTKLPFYFLKLIAISINGERLALSPTIFTRPGTMLDSGTVISRLPPTAYLALRDTFRKHMVHYPKAPPLGKLDTCYDFTNHEKVEVPLIALIFDGEVTINLAFSGIIYVITKSHACLAFIENINDRHVVIIGNKQQHKLTIVTDVGNSRIGFGANGCG